jgi:hypothetical protein
MGSKGLYIDVAQGKNHVINKRIPQNDKDVDETGKDKNIAFQFFLGCYFHGSLLLSLLAAVLTDA